MPLEASLEPVAGRVADLNARYRHHGATAVLAHAMSDPMVGRIALVSSFGAESVVLLHMLAVADRTAPVLFIDTEMLFPETLAYQAEVVAHLGLTDVRIIRPDRDALFTGDNEGLLHRRDPDACCALRKTEPLQRALAPFDAWITGRKRFQGGQRTVLDFFEDENGQRIKVNPLAHWTREDVQDYILNNRLPRHPLVARGYPSIGCMPCTTAVRPGEDERAGRWRGREKEECGIHFVNGRMVRGPAPAPDATAEPETALPGDALTGNRPAEPESPMNDLSPKAAAAALTADMAEAAAPAQAIAPSPVPGNVIVTDAGFAADTAGWRFEPLPANDAALPPALDLPSDTRPDSLAGRLAGVSAIRIAFPSFADGRGFTIARNLRRMGFDGRLRAHGHVIADQYAMARRAGFDEVEIAADLARRQDESQWRARADWQAHDYRARLAGG